MIISIVHRSMWTGSHRAEDTTRMEKYELEDGKSEIVKRPNKTQGKASIWKQFLRFVSIRRLGFSLEISSSSMCVIRV